MKPQDFRALDPSRFAPFDGYPQEVEFGPPMTEAQIESVEREIGYRLPLDCREAMRCFSSVSAAWGDFYMSGSPSHSDPRIVPKAFWFGPDGLGNCWVVDIASSTEERSNIFFWCHDPPIYGFQASGFEELWDQAAQFLLTGMSPLERTQTDMSIYQDESMFVSRSQALQSPDTAAFAQSLDDSWSFVDLRGRCFGTGFNWINVARDLEGVRRHGDELIFAVQRPQPKKKGGFLAKLFTSKKN